MRRSRRSFALSDIVHLFAGLAALAGAAAGLGGCTGADVARVYGYQGAAVETGSIDVSGQSSGMSRVQQDAIIGEAIAAHEMRRP
jgi:hypothetical protein